MSKIIIIIPSPDESIDILLLISRFSVELKRAEKQIIILRSNVASDAQIISRLAREHNIKRVPCLVYGKTVVVGQSRVCSTIAAIIKSIKAQSEKARARAPCPTVNQYMTQIMLSGEDEVVDDDPEKAKETMVQRMTDYRARTKAQMPDISGASDRGTRPSAPETTRRTARTTHDPSADDRKHDVTGTVVEQEISADEEYDVVQSAESDGHVLHPVDHRAVETSVRQSVQRLPGRELDACEGQFYESIADYAATS